MTSTQRTTDRFGAFGGRYVPETLIPALDELEARVRRAAQADAAFRARARRRCCATTSAVRRR